jgi:CRISPR-associated protein Csb2
MLAMDVEYLLGVCFAASGYSDIAPDWPPQIDRLYSALVATWAARGQRPDEKLALQFLERLPPPLVNASTYSPRFAPPVFVPPNDSGGSQIQVLPGRRRRQERRFPAAIPDRPLTSYIWPTADTEPSVLSSLERLAHDVSYVGHSTSLVRCFFQKRHCTLEDASTSRRRIYPGRLEALEAAFKKGVRPASGLSFHAVESPPEPPSSVFGREWLVFSDAGGHCFDIRRTAVAARSLRTAIMSGFRGGPVPEVISGHGADGRPSARPHMAIFPLANIGWRWGDGRLMGLAICLPRETEPQDEEKLYKALFEIALGRKRSRDADDTQEDCEIGLNLPSGEIWRLARQPEPIGSSLKPARYLRSARFWATATPIALDRHPKTRDHVGRQQEIARSIGQSCVRIGLPMPIKVVADKHSAIRGSAPAWSPRRSPEWLDWAMPGSLNGHAFTHATVEFAEPVRGPIALGAGRFFGLGLCLPIDAEDDR